MIEQRRFGYSSSQIKTRMRWLYLASSSQIAYTGIVSLLLLSGMYQDSSGRLATNLNVLMVLATSLTGFGLGRLFNHLTWWRIGRITPMIGFWATLLFLICPINNVYALMSYVLILSMVNSLEGPNFQTTIPQVVAKKQLHQAYARIQTMLQTGKLLLPIMINIGLRILTIKPLIGLMSLGFLFANYAFSQLATDQKALPMEQTKLIGYKAVFKNSKLMSLTYFRVANNMAYSICATAMPMILLHLSNSKTQVRDLDNLSDFLTGICFVGVGWVVSKYLAQDRSIMVSLGVLTPVIACLGIIGLAYYRQVEMFLLFSALLGVGLFAGRLSIISIGQAITPPEMLAISILLGDSLTRTSSLLLNLLFAYLVNGLHLDIYLVLVGFCSLSLTGLIGLKQALK